MNHVCHRAINRLSPNPIVHLFNCAKGLIGSKGICTLKCIHEVLIQDWAEQLEERDYCL